MNRQDASDEADYSGCDIDPGQLKAMCSAFGVEDVSVGVHFTAEDRDREMARLRSEGVGLAEIGERFHVTRERVRQILLKSGGPTAEDARQARVVKREVESQRLKDRVRNALERHGACTPDELSRHLSMSTDEIRRYWPPEMKAYMISPKSQEPTWADAEIRQALQLASTFDFPLRSTAYDELVARGEVRGPSAVRIIQRFGTWRAACADAGVEGAKPPRSDYQSKWTDEDLLAFVRRYLESGQGSGSFHGYDKWQRDDDSAPSGGTLRGRFGSWAEAKRRALQGTSNVA